MVQPLDTSSTGSRRLGRVIATVFAGRETMIRVLMQHLRRELLSMRLTDVHLWDFCGDDSDSVYLRSLESDQIKV